MQISVNNGVSIPELFQIFHLYRPHPHSDTFRFAHSVDKELEF